MQTPNHALQAPEGCQLQRRRGVRFFLKLFRSFPFPVFPVLSVRAWGAQGFPKRGRSLSGHQLTWHGVAVCNPCVPSAGSLGSWVVSPFIPQTTPAQELFGVEGCKIVRLLAEADEFDGQPSSFWIATTMPPLLVPSSLVTIRPVSGTALLNSAPVERVHADAAVEHEQDFVWRAGQLLADDAMQLSVTPA